MTLVYFRSTINKFDGLHARTSIVFLNMTHTQTEDLISKLEELLYFLIAPAQQKMLRSEPQILLVHRPTLEDL